MDKSPFEDTVEKDIEKLENAGNVGLKSVKKTYDRKPVTTMMSPELRKIIRVKYVEEDISLATFLEIAILEKLERDGNLA